jgi:DNA (cytosine-5)-methyltransferase 1
MNVLDLFSGIGGFSLGLERAGMRTVAFCECDPYARAVLQKHWPDALQYDDVRTINALRLFADGIKPDVICGGFPCQDISVANVAGKGLEGERSGLWREYARLVGELRPQFVIVENVSALLDRGLGRVLGDLAALGYDAEWHCVPASAVGAPHRRDRVWIVSYPQRTGRERPFPRAGILGPAFAAQSEYGYPFIGARSALGGDFSDLRDGDGLSVAMERRRLHALGNAVVPQIPEIIGRAIMRATNEAHAVTGAGKVHNPREIASNG